MPMITWDNYGLQDSVYVTGMFQVLTDNKYQKQDKSANSNRAICHMAWCLSYVWPYGISLNTYQPIKYQLRQTFCFDQYIYIYIPVILNLAFIWRKHYQLAG